MVEAFVIRNQLGQYLTKKGDWDSGKDAAVIYHQPFYDQALNQLIEMNAKDVTLRGKVEAVELDDKKRPLISEYGPDPVQPELIEAENGGELEAVEQEDMSAVL